MNSYCTWRPPTYTTSCLVVRVAIALASTRAGLTVASLADQLGVSERTVERYLAALRKEFGYQVRVEKRRYKFVGVEAAHLAGLTDA